MMDYLKTLSLKPETGALVAPFAFSEPARVSLAVWLSVAVIDVLQSRIEVAIPIEKAMQDEPKLAELKDFLQRVHDLAKALGALLENAPTDASGLLDLVAQQNLGGWAERYRMVVHLKGLSDGVAHQLGKHNWKSVRSAYHLFMVGEIADVVLQHDVDVSVSEGSPFLKICKIVFDAVNTRVDSLGVIQSDSVDPRGAIRAYIKQHQSS
jgi:hypothetical protein